MEFIYILDKDGSPLMPTKRKGHVQKLLKKGMARVISRVPMVVQMKYNAGAGKQPLHGGTDPGRTNIGNAVVKDTGDTVYKDHVTADNKDVPKHMAERRAHRQASRRGERQARKRLAKKHGTDREFPDGRMLPGCGEPVMPKDIINTEARFMNRKRSPQWLTPTVRNLVEAHLNMVRRICRILPVTDWTLEANRFAFMWMEDGSIRGIDFQNGRMKGFDSPEGYVSYLQDGRCAFCGGKIEHYHHIRPRSEGGSDLPENLVGVCLSCHRKIHTGVLDTSMAGLKKKYAALSVLNQAIPYIYEGLVNMFGEENVRVCQGYDTASARELLGITKDHPEDAVCIAAMLFHTDAVQDETGAFEVVQFRRHDRAIINSQRERTYYLDGKAVAKNRKPRFEQRGKALSSLCLPREDVSRLTVKKSRRYYNNPGRLMPGAEITYEGTRHIVTGQLSGGQYFRVYGGGTKNVPASKCRVIRKNVGLVYV